MTFQERQIELGNYGYYEVLLEEAKRANPLAKEYIEGRINLHELCTAERANNAGIKTFTVLPSRI